jgi:hypothetical protein
VGFSLFAFYWLAWFAADLMTGWLFLLLLPI